jgi:meso-butanediol dehydrogenase/(S,S)-butanediol dehydrogenase/diacetyl reductase
MKRLADHICVITGAGRGIGRAIALRYAAAGAALVVSDVDANNAAGVVAEIRQAGGRASAIGADVRDPAQSRKLIEQTVAEFGRVDVFVNNAGVVRITALLETTPEDWDFVTGVNERGFFFALQAAARQMVNQAPLAAGRPRGKIINTASIAGRAGRPTFAPYAASKAAAISITQSAAQALAPEVTVNAICPGVVDTAMWKQIDQEWSALDNQPIGSAWARRIRGIPMGRPQVPEDLTGMALFLASADSDYVTGQAYNVDGGLVMS